MNKLPKSKVEVSTEIETSTPLVKPIDTTVIKTETTKAAATKDITPKTVDIVCCDCQAIRTIPKGEAFQVKRCKVCQVKHAKELRKVYRKNKVRGLKERVLKLEAILHENKIAVPA